MLNYINFKNFNKKHKNNSYFIPIGENTYRFKVYWSDDCNCAFLSIYDYNDKPIIMGRALVNNLIIRNFNLPYTFCFLHNNNETYEPTIDNIEKEYILFFEDGK